jgi:hypothetical protein
MDRGEAFKREITIRPTEEGSFVVSYGGGSSILQYRQHGFTNVSDLLDWLVAHAQAFSADKIAADVTHELTEGEVVRSDTPLADMAATFRKHGPQPLGFGAFRRTTAAEKMFPFTGMSAAQMKAVHTVADGGPGEPKPAA